VHTISVTDIAPKLQSAVRLLNERRPAEAARLLRDVVTQHPSSADARRLLGIALRDHGDIPGADAQLHEALKLAPASGPAAVALSEILAAAGRFEEALAVLAPLASAASNADIHVLTAQGVALKGLFRFDEAIIAYERAIAAAPRSGVAEHNLAALLGDMERFRDAEMATRRAFAKGLDAPETWLVHARALAGQGRHEEAEAAFGETIRRRPDLVDAHGELAQLIWMRTEDIGAAAFALDKAIAAFPRLQALVLKKTELLDCAGEPEAAYDTVAAIAMRSDAGPGVLVAAARLIMRRNPDLGLRYAMSAARAVPGDLIAESTLCEAYLARGDAEAAVQVARRLHESAPFDQNAIGLLATAWRLAGDPRDAELHDHGNLVRAARIDTPDGWNSLEAYLADLTTRLESLHTLRTHPIGQSVRHGSQTSQSLTLSEDPVIQAFFRAVDGPIRGYMRALGEGGDIVRSRNTGDYLFNGVWSIRLRPDGYHADHLHPRGWLSSACYISLPSAVEREPEGWLKFGEPGIATTPALAARHFVKPEPGLLVLFPSYMWHGTVPFTGDEPRLTIAFDLLPA
jgi:tetratricopeptide (TPR) repeat protein